MTIPNLSKRQIAEKAHDIISFGGYNPPIPVELIIEGSFNIQLEIDDINQILKNDEEILGAIFIDSRKIIINQNLANEDSDKAAGRYYFTCAHELGHWILHRNINNDNISNTNGSTIFCRIKDNQNFLEWQANYFAASLLMPDFFVKQAFYSVFGEKPIDIFNVDRNFKSIIGYDFCLRNWGLIAQDICDAGQFTNVSKLAMILRLDELGLVKNHTNKKFGWKQ